MANAHDEAVELYLNLMRREAPKADIRAAATAAGIPAEAVESDLQYLARARQLLTHVDTLLDLCAILDGLGARLTAEAEASDRNVMQHEKAFSGLVDEARGPLGEACKECKGMHALVKLSIRRPKLFSEESTLLLTAIGKNMTPVIEAHQEAAVPFSVEAVRNHLQRIAALFRGAAKPVGLVTEELRKSVEPSTAPKVS